MGTEDLAARGAHPYNRVVPFDRRGAIPATDPQLLKTTTNLGGCGWNVSGKSSMPMVFLWTGAEKRAILSHWGVIQFLPFMDGVSYEPEESCVAAL
jgi:hypothetical protein